MLAMDIAKFSGNAADYVNRAVRFNEIVSVATNEGGAVLMGMEDYNALMETVYLFSHPQTARDIRVGLAMPWDDCVALA